MDSKKLQWSSTDVQTWTVKELVEARNGVSSKKRLIKIPTYQRNLVWSKKQQKELISSIKKWFPIWAMLLYKARNENDIDIYHLIDWLQRSTTLKNYLDKPTTFLDFEDLPEWIFQNIFSIFKKHVVIEWLDVKIVNIVKLWLNELEWFEVTKKFDPKILTKFTEDSLWIELSRHEYEELLRNLDSSFTNIKDQASIDFQQIPILIYTGDISNLPIIFEKLNHWWTQLSKYQVYAATWSLSDYYINILNKDIIKKIKEKYQSLEKDWLILEKPDDIDDTSKFNYFEYFFWLWKHLTDKFNLKLFEVTKNWNDTDSIWFNLWALCLWEDIKKMDWLPKHIKDNNIDINFFSTAMEDSVEIAWWILQPYIWIKANSKAWRMTNIYHTELQIVSIIGKIFNSKYNNKTFEQKNDWKEKEKLLRQNIPFHYLFHILRWYWSWTGDSKANELVKNKTYEDRISKESWEWVFNEFKISELQKKERNRVNPSPSSILIFKYIYWRLLSQHEVLKNDFEIEHLCPVARLKIIAGKMLNDEWLPISAIWNLCLIEKEKNREKWDKTFYEFYDESIIKGRLWQNEVDSILEEIESNRIFCNRDDLNFSKNFNENQIEMYISFIEKRFDRIKKLFYEKNQISD